MTRRAGIARLRMASRFLLRSLDLRRSSFLLALASIAVGVSVAATAFNLKADVGRKMTRDLRAFGANLLVTAPAGPTGRTEPLGQEPLARAGALLGSSPFAVLSYTPVSTRSGGALRVGIGGGDGARELYSYWRVEGAWPDSTAPPSAGTAGGCLVGSRLAARLGVRIGDPIEMSPSAGPPERLVVTGIVRTGESEEDEILVPQSAPASAPPAVLLARVDGGAAAVEDLARRIEAAGLRARPIRQVSEAEGSLMGRLDLMLGLLATLLVVLTGLCVATTLVSMVVEREPEIGLMRALGAGDGEILLMLLGEATLLGVAGGLAGFGLGALNALLVGRRLFGTTIAPRPEVLPVVVGLSVGLCWLAAAGPLRRALRVRPADALRGE